MQESGWFVAHVPGRGAISLAARSPAQVPVRGTMMVEFALMPGETGPLSLLALEGRSTVETCLSLGFDGAGRLALLQRRGDAVHALSLDAAAECAAGGRMRVTWRWDLQHDESLLSLEALDAGSLRQRSATAPLPVTRAEMMALAEARAPARLGPRLDFLALGDHLHPLGPAACFAPSTPIATPRGERPAGSLRPGDLVETVDAGAQPVLWSGRIALPALGSMRPVRLCAPAFGATRDLWLLPQHRIALGGPAVDYLFGEDEVLIAARHLVDGCAAQQPDRPCVLNWHGLLLADHHLLIADGCRIESLGVGRLARQPVLARSTALSDLAAAGTLPQHCAPVRRSLLPFEVQALGSARDQGRGPIAA